MLKCDSQREELSGRERLFLFAFANVLLEISGFDFRDNDIAPNCVVGGNTFDETLKSLLSKKIIKYNGNKIELTSDAFTLMFGGEEVTNETERLKRLADLSVKMLQTILKDAGPSQ